MQFNYRNIIPLLGKLIYQPRDPECKRKLSVHVAGWIIFSCFQKNHKRMITQ